MQRQKRIPLARRFWGSVLRFLIRLFLQVEVRGLENIPGCGAGIVYYNHIHWLDPVLISDSLPRYAVPLAKIEASRWPVVGWLLRWYRVIFITRGAVDRAALQATWGVLQQGDLSVISPEGTRSHSGQLQRAKEGLTFVARQVPEAWLIPCAVTGTQAFRWGVPLVKRTRVTLTYGRPFTFRWPAGRTSREVLREMADEAMLQLAALLPPEMRGDYADENPPSTHWIAPLSPLLSSTY